MTDWDPCIDIPLRLGVVVCIVTSGVFFYLAFEDGWDEDSGAQITVTGQQTESLVNGFIDCSVVETGSCEDRTYGFGQCDAKIDDRIEQGREGTFGCAETCCLRYRSRRGRSRRCTSDGERFGSLVGASVPAAVASPDPNLSTTV